MNDKERVLFDLLRQNLTSDLLHRNFPARPGIPYYGHCYHATEALYRLLGGKEAGYKVCRAVDSTGSPHYWLLSPEKEIIDPTVEQYTSVGCLPPHKDGKGTGFRNPSKSAAKLIQRVKNGLPFSL